MRAPEIISSLKVISFKVSSIELSLEVGCLVYYDCGVFNQITDKSMIFIKFLLFRFWEQRQNIIAAMDYIRG